MSHSIQISDEAYERLERAAKQTGMSSVEQYIESLPAHSDALRNRAELGREIDRLYERVRASIGQMPDSTELIRADRER